MHDAATGFQDVEVGRAFEAEFPFIEALARPAGVGVGRVDEGGG